ncbi:hypothetical protein D3C72_2491330 [compost metagenome]
MNDAFTDTAEALLRKITKPDAGEIFRIPTFLMGEISPLAGNRAGGTIERA